MRTQARTERAGELQDSPWREMLPSTAMPDVVKPFMTLAAAIAAGPAAVRTGRIDTTVTWDASTVKVPSLPRDEFGMESVSDFWDFLQTGKVAGASHDPSVRFLETHGIRIPYFDDSGSESDVTDMDESPASAESLDDTAPALSPAEWKSSHPTKSILKTRPSDVVAIIRTPVPIADMDVEGGDDQSFAQHAPSTLVFGYSSEASFGSRRASVNSRRESVLPLAAPGDPSVLVCGYASDVSPASRRASMVSSKRASFSIGVQPDIPDDIGGSDEESRAARRKSGLDVEERLRSRKASVTPVENANSGSLICKSTGLGLDIIIAPGARSGRVNTAVQCSGIDIDAELDTVFGTVAKHVENSPVAQSEEASADIIPVEIPESDNDLEPEVMRSQSPLRLEPAELDDDDYDHQDANEGGVGDENMSLDDAEQTNQRDFQDQSGAQRRCPLTEITFSSSNVVNIEPQKAAGGQKRKNRAPRKQRRVGADDDEYPYKRRWRELKHLPVERARKAMEKEDDNPTGLRRSTRQRFPRLKHWKNECIVYERRKSQIMPTISEIIVEIQESDSSGEEDDCWLSRAGSKKTKSKKRARPPLADSRKRAKAAPRCIELS